MKNIMSLAIAVLAIATWSAETWAKNVTISATHSRTEIARKCDAVGGVKFGTSGRSGKFGCDNIGKQTSVTCDAQGHCTGWVPE